MFSGWFWFVTLVCAVQINGLDYNYDYYQDFNKEVRAGGANDCGGYNCKNWTTQGISACPNAEQLRTYLERCITLVTKDNTNPCGFIVCDYNPSVDGCGRGAVKGTRMLCAVGTVWDDVTNKCVGACLKPGIICPTIAPPAGDCQTTRRSGGA